MVGPVRASLREHLGRQRDWIRASPVLRRDRRATRLTREPCFEIRGRLMGAESTRLPGGDETRGEQDCQRREDAEDKVEGSVHELIVAYLERERVPWASSRARRIALAPALPAVRENPGL